MLHSHHLAQSGVTQVSLSWLSPLQPDVFPEMEILWLLTRAWNTGILLYSLAQYPEAERWCGLAMSFLRHLGTLQESYERQVQQWTRRGSNSKTLKILLQVFLNLPLFVCAPADVCALWWSAEQVGQNQEEPHGRVKWSRSTVAGFFDWIKWHCCSFAFNVVVLRRSNISVHDDEWFATSLSLVFVCWQ